MIRTPYTAVVLLALTLAACGPILPKGPAAPRLFSLKADIPAAAHTAPVSLQIVEPTAAPGLDSDRIALKKSANEIDYYADAKWAGPLPIVLREAAVDAIERAHVVSHVTPDTLASAAAYRLALDITDFQAEYNGVSAPAVRVRLVARLLKSPAGEIIASDAIEETAPASGNTLQDVIAAENKAFAAAVEKLAMILQQRLPH